jgi:N-acetylmuramoyl-L-alanine amidase
VTLTHPSPNFGDRRGGQVPTLVVLHYTAMASCAEALARLCDPSAEVSAHYLIDRDGTVLSLVDEAKRAWHAGAGEWAGAADVNSRSIGIELVNRGDEPYPQPLMQALEGLLADILQRRGLPPRAVIGHSDMAPGRKGDPGPRFDWRRLAVAGLSVWPEPAAPGDFVADLRAFGYPDLGADLLLPAFRLRFRPWATGPLDDTDRALAAGLARFPVDATPPNA